MELISLKKIWNAAPHNAFTDLERYRGRWYCAFREGQGHAGNNDYGKIRVLVSDDGETWVSSSLLEVSGVDLRDAKLSVMPDGQLLLNSCEYRVDDNNNDIRNNQSVTYLSKDGKSWEGPFHIANQGYWLWQTTWYQDVGYALGYQWGTSDATRFYQTRDGKMYTMFLDHPRPAGDRSNEHAMVFNRSGRSYLLLRRDNGENIREGDALLGIADSPYRDWEWKKLGVTVGGPSMIQLDDGRLLTCIRRYQENDHRNWGSQWTELGWIDPEKGTYTKGLKLPSKGDSSYAGLIWHNGLLWLSYYSSHEDKTSIYLAKIKVSMTA